MDSMKALDHLSKDKKLSKLIAEFPAEIINRIQGDQRVREHLIGSIMSQQLSVKVAQVFHSRFMKYYKGKFPSSNKIIKTDIEDLRNLGLSYQKVNYIRNIAIYFEEHKIKNSDFVPLTDDEIIAKLTQIKGVGKWTVEMVLIFCLGRKDVFAIDDYGVLTAMKSIFKLNLEGKELKNKMLSLSEKWRPYRSTVCLYLWAWKDAGKP